MKEGVCKLAFRFFLLCIIGIGVPHRNSLAQSKIDYYLGEVVVFAKRIVDNPYSQLEIRLSNQDQNSNPTIGYLLKSVPGIFIRSGRKNELGMYLRGFRQQEIVILLDGHPIYEPYFGTMDLGQLLLDDIAKVKITKGPASSLYGPNAMGGVINIVTQSPKDTPLFSALVESGTGNYGHLKFVHGYHWGKIRYRINYSRMKQNGFPLSSKFIPTDSQNRGVRNHSGFTDDLLSTQVQWNPSVTTIFNVSAGWLKSQKEIPPSTQDHPRFWDFPDWQRRYLDVSAKHDYSKNITLSTKFYTDWFGNTLIAFKDRNYRVRKWKSRYKNRVGGGMIMGAFNSQKWGHWQGVLHIKKDMVHIQNDVGLPWETFNAFTNSVGIQGAINPNAFLSFLVGTSLDQLIDKRKHSLLSFNPQFGMVYRVSNPISIRTLVGKKSRFPTLKEWYGSLYGNRLLKPEQTLSAEVGVQFEESERLSLYSTYFFNEAKNLISQKSRHAPFENIDAAKINGIELSGKVLLSNQFSASFGYTYLSAKNRQDNTQLPFRPLHQWTAQVNQLIPIVGTLHIDAVYTGKRSYNDYGKKQTLAPYVLFHAKLTLHKWHSLIPYFQVLNAFDAYYEDECGFPMPGREIRVGASLSPHFEK